MTKPTKSQIRMYIQARAVRVLKHFGRARLAFLSARLLYRLTVEGEERIPREGPCLFPMNHAAPVADGLTYLVIAYRRPDVYLFGWQALGDENPANRFLEGIGEGIGERLLRAYRAEGISAGELLRAYRVLRRGGAIALNPEGELTWDGRLQYPFRSGTAWLALRTGAPVIPVVSVGGYDIQPRWWMEKIHLTGRLTIRVGEPFTLCDRPLAHVTAERLEEANQRLWKAMARLLQSPGSADRFDIRTQMASGQSRHSIRPDVSDDRPPGAPRRPAPVGDEATPESRPPPRRGSGDGNGSREVG